MYFSHLYVKKVIVMTFLLRQKSSWRQQGWQWVLFTLCLFFTIQKCTFSIFFNYLIFSSCNHRRIALSTRLLVGLPAYTTNLVHQLSSKKNGATYQPIIIFDGVNRATKLGKLNKLIICSHYFKNVSPHLCNP